MTNRIKRHLEIYKAGLHFAMHPDLQSYELQLVLLVNHGLQYKHVIC